MSTLRNSGMQKKSNTWKRILVLALAYLFMGVALLAASQPLDNAVFIWFPAGIAYIGLMVGGRRCWPGVWLGGFFTALYFDFSESGAIFAVICASAVSLQAYVAVLITQPYVKARFPVARERDILATLVLAGPVSSLIAATVASGTLYFQGKTAASDWFGEWLLWWSADSLGVIIGAPLFLLAWPSALRLVAQRSDAYRIVLPISVIAALLLAGNLGYANLERDRDRILTSQALSEAGRSDFRQAADVLDYLKGVGLFFSSSENISREEFEEYTSLAIDIDAVLAIDWAPRVEEGGRELFENNFVKIIRNEDSYSQAGEGGHISTAGLEYFPVLYSRTLSDAKNIIGFDHGSVVSRRLVMQKSAAGKHISSTKVEKLAGSELAAILVYLPVYKSRRNENPLETKAGAELLGFVVGTFDVNKIFGALTGKSLQNKMAFRVIDITPGSESGILIDNVPDGAIATKIHTMKFGDRLWQLEMVSAAGNWRAGRSAESRLYLIFSVVVTLIAVFAVLGSAGRNASVIKQLARKATELEAELQARHVAEKALSDSEQDLSITLHSIGEAVLTTDAEGRIKRLNAMAENMTGWSSAEALGHQVKDVYMVCNEDGSKEIVDPIEEVLKHGIPLFSRKNMHLVARDGRISTVAHTASPIRDDSAVIRGAVLVFRDVSRHVRAQKELKVREDRYRSLINLSPFAIIVHCEGEIVFVNPMAIKMLAGSSSADLLKKSILTFVGSDFHSMITDRIEGREKGDLSTVTLDCEGLGLDGKKIPLSFTSTPYEFEGRKGSLLIMQDISSRREKEQLVDRFFSLSQDVLCIAGSDGVFQRVNAALVKALGWSEEELTSRKLLSFVHPDDRAATADAVRLINAGVIIERFENRYLCHDGSWRRFEWKALPQPDGLFFASGRDCTDRHENAEKMRLLNQELAQRVEDRSAALTALHAKEQEVRAVLDNLLECVVTIDACGIVKTANPAVQKVFGYSPDELVGRNVSILMDYPHLDFHDGYIARYIETRRPRIIGSSREVSGRHRNGEEIPLELSLVEYDVHGDIFFVGTLHDIRARKRLISDLTTAREAAEQASRAKSAFLASMSHEIRTPMNGVIGLIDVLDATKLDERQADLVGTIKESSGTLLGIIDDILDFSKIEAGNMSLDVAPVSILDVVEGLCNTLLPTALRVNAVLHIFVDPGLPKSFLSDEIKLHQILYNLVGNAIKFASGRDSKRGSIDVRVTGVDSSPLKICISVADNGIGICSEKIEEIFNPFIQAEASTTRRYGGTGLGLAITKRLVDLMAGEIQVESTLGLGSTFSVILPIDVVDDGRAGNENADLSGVNCIFPKNMPSWVRDLQVYLRSAGAATFEVDGRVALDEKAKSLAAPVVYIDSQCLHETGNSELLELDGQFKRLLLTEGRRRRARRQDPRTITIDANALRKSAFFKAVAVAAGLASPEKKGPASQLYQARREYPPALYSGTDFGGPMILVAEDDPINQKVILQQLALLGHVAHMAANGREALSMWSAGKYSLLLTDLHMPEMDGYTLIREVRALPASAARPSILAITANALRGEEQKAIEAGVDAYLTKPIRLEELERALRKWMPAVRPGEDNMAEECSINVEAMKRIIGDSPKDIMDFLGDFRSISASYVNDMRAAVQSRDFLSIEAVAHKLKSAARFIGAFSLGGMAEELEKISQFGNEYEIDKLFRAFEVEFTAVERDVSKIFLDLKSQEL